MSLLVKTPFPPIPTYYRRFGLEYFQQVRAVVRRIKTANKHPPAVNFATWQESMRGGLDRQLATEAATERKPIAETTPVVMNVPPAAIPAIT